jgi:hypothetical protein
MIQNQLFYCKNKDTYPPFKNGLYLEEFFLKKIADNKDIFKRKYIPALWTNFQIEGWFHYKKFEMQQALDKWILNNPSDEGYFTITQYDDGPLLNLPSNTVKYGACSGDTPLPLIYQDINNKLENIPKKNFNEKTIICSFVGAATHSVREVCINKFRNNLSTFELHVRNGWSANVTDDLSNLFIEKTVNSKFALAPRGYGRSSFRFFEVFKLGTIPIYVWDDIEWLPYKDKIDYTKICISINVKDIDKLEDILLNINEEKYNEMINNYDKVRNMFELEYLYEYVIKMNM